MENSKEIRGGTASVKNVLSGSGAGGITIWSRDLGFVGGDVPEDGRISRGITHIDDGA